MFPELEVKYIIMDPGSSSITDKQEWLKALTFHLLMLKILLDN